MPDGYGDVVYFEVLGQPFYQLNDPDDIRYVLVDNNENYTKGSFLTEQFGEFLGKGLLLNEGDDWRRQRHLVQGAFDPDLISTYAVMMTDHTERLLDSWQPGTPRDIHTDMTQLTLEFLQISDTPVGGDWRRITMVCLSAPVHFPRRGT